MILCAEPPPRPGPPTRPPTTLAPSRHSTPPAGLFDTGVVAGPAHRDALTALEASSVDLMATGPLLDRMWDLRDNVFGYDAAYIAVAETLDCALVTADARLRRVSNLRCEIRVALPTT